LQLGLPCVLVLVLVALLQLVLRRVLLLQPLLLVLV